jgi:hypothetical protein
MKNIPSWRHKTQVPEDDAWTTSATLSSTCRSDHLQKIAIHLIWSASLAGTVDASPTWDLPILDFLSKLNWFLATETKNNFDLPKFILQVGYHEVYFNLTSPELLMHYNTESVAYQVNLTQLSFYILISAGREIDILKISNIWNELIIFWKLFFKPWILFKCYKSVIGSLCGTFATQCQCFLPSNQFTQKTVQIKIEFKTQYATSHEPPVIFLPRLQQTITQQVAHLSHQIENPSTLTFPIQN